MAPMPAPPPHDSAPVARRRRGRPVAALSLASLLFVGALGGAAVATNAGGIGDRWERVVARVEAFVHPPPDRSTVATVNVTQRPTASPTPSELPIPHQGWVTPTPSPTPARVPVDVNLVSDAAAVFHSEMTNRDCAAAGTQIVLTILGLGNASDAFQVELHNRIGEWESWDDSHNGGWGPAAVRLALAAYGAPGYEERAYDSYTDALRDSAVAVSQLDMPVLMFPWWGAHTWVMTGYRADADPTFYPDATVSGAYILDPWYPRFSTIWGQSDPPGNFEDLAELVRNWPVHGGPHPYEAIGPGWTRPEGAYPTRDGKFVVLIPTIARADLPG